MPRPARSRSSIRRGPVATVEPLEARTLLSAGQSLVTAALDHPAPGFRRHPREVGAFAPALRHARPLVHHAPAVRPNARGAEPLMAIRPDASASPTGLTPAQLRKAYGFDQLSQTGAGQTIYIIDAYDDPTIASDLHTFDQKFGLADPSFTKATPQGKPSSNGGWALEISLDVEWAHVVAPAASIVLVEAASNSYANLYGAVDYAVGQGAHIVSMSWGGGDSSGESSYDSHFNVPGVTFVASAGDSGGVVEYPSASPYVVSVGGTTLHLADSTGTYGSESAWSSGGGGASKYEAAPGYQTSFGLSYSGRATPDVSYDADPNTGFSVYDSTRYNGQRGWFQVGGTSAGAPQWAALVALADQGRSTPLSSASLTSSAVYDAAIGTLYGTNYHDITTGSNGYAAGPRYDLATGIGSPIARNVVPWLNQHS